MILKEFPDIAWLKKQIETNFGNQRRWDNLPLPHAGWPSVVLNVKTRKSERIDIKGPFSIFMNVKGWSTVAADGQNIRINQNAYVLTNHEQHYNLLIDEPEATETLNIHFGEKFYTDILYALKNTDEYLLDNLDGKYETYNIPIKTVFRDPAFNNLVGLLLFNSSSGRFLEEESLFHLFNHVFRRYLNDNNTFNNLNDLKRSTREEIHQRLLLARDYIHVFYQQNISLQELADISCLSRFHFLRLFKKAFHISPYQYIKKIRLQQAIYLIGTQKYTLEDIALKVGLQNGSSLSRIIYQDQGVYPSALFMKRN